MSTSTKYTADEVVELGKVLYEAGIRQQVETNNIGKYLMINIETGQWTLGSDHLETALRARQESGDDAIFGMRIGYPAAESMNGEMRQLCDAREQEAIGGVRSDRMEPNNAARNRTAPT